MLIYSQCLAVIGGLTELRQTRLLKKRPEIVVATPGRLWDLIQKVMNQFTSCIFSLSRGFGVKFGFENPVSV